MDNMYSKEAKEKVNDKFGYNVVATIEVNRKRRSGALIDMIALLEIMLKILKEIADEPLKYSDYNNPHIGYQKTTWLWDNYVKLRTALKEFMPLYRELGNDLKRDKRKFTDIMKMRGE